MKRNIKKIFIVIFVTCCVCLFNINVSAKSIDGTFKVIQSNIPDRVDSIKLKDGRLLLYSSEGNAIFDPKTNKLKKTASFKSRPKINFNSILLPDGKVLFVRPTTFYPSEEFGSEIYHLIHDDLFKKELGKLKKVTSLTNEGYNNIRHEAWKAYKVLSEQEKEKIYLPYIKKNPELYKRYQNYIKEYELSMYGQIFDPTTETFKYTKGKVNIRRNGFQLFLLDDRKVLIIGGQADVAPNVRPPKIVYGKVDYSAHFERAAQIEIYDPKTETFQFSPVVIPKKYYGSLFFQLKNGEMYSLNPRCIFNFTNNEFRELRELLDLFGREYIMLNDGQIAFIPDSKEVIRIFNPETGQITAEGQLLIPRDQSFKMVQLADGNILIYGGINRARSGPYSGKMYENRLEIFNPKTGKSQLLNKRHIGFIYSVTLLDDGRLFFIGANGYELLKIK